jgi:tetratricopeptide (TPR) repeat protein
MKTKERNREDRSGAKADGGQVPAKAPSKKRVLLFKLISILIPFLLIFLLEVALRIFHYGNDLSLFMEYPADKGYLVMNPAASKKYFTHQANATTGNIEPFKKEKDGNTLRIFVLGESTTIGYPYFHNGSFHRWLEYRLMHEYPDKNFEIINVSLTAVNSYTVLGFAKEVAGYQPDAILIYTGHNEYYGALGVGSTDRIGGNPAMVRLLLSLRELRFTQLLTNAYEKIVGWFSSHEKNSGKTRMEAMVGEQQIPYQSKLYERGIGQFRSNMEATLDLFNRRHIPVFISDLVSNEKDLWPFISIAADSVRFPEFIKDYELGLKSFADKDTGAAARWFGQANGIYNGHARCNFYLGRLAWQRGDSVEARLFFSRARELDALRFRAPDSINTVIAELCKKYDNTHLVDTRAAFEGGSGQGIIGDELILEHVHPNLAGYALMSDVFYKEMKKAGLFPAGKGEEMGLQQLLHDMPVTKMDSLAAAYRVANLKRSWPFTQPGGGAGSAAARDTAGVTGSMEATMAERLTVKQESWEGAMGALYDYYIGTKDLVNAGRIVEGLVLEHPTEAAYYEKAANVYGQLGHYENTAFYFRRAFALAPSFDKARNLFVIYLKLDRPSDAVPYLDWAIANNVSGMQLGPVKQFVGEVIQLQKGLGRDSTNLSVLNQIAGKYFQMGNTEGGFRYMDKILKLDPKNKEALSMQAMYKKG